MKVLPRFSFSTVLVFGFFLILLFLSLFAEIFESQAPEVDIAQIYANPVPISEFKSLKSITFTNKNGRFLFENSDPLGHLEGPWQMTEPQALKLKATVIAQIIDTLSVIRVRNFHRLEPINISSFSLDNPTLVLNLMNDKNKALEVKMGLINPIDNSAYLTVSGIEQIYQIDPLEMALESYDLSQLVESKVLALNQDSLQSLEIYGEEGLRLKLLRKIDQWVDQNGVVLVEAKIKKFFSNLEEMKSFSILDKLTPEQQSFMEKTMATTSYSLKLITSQGVRTFLISKITGQIPGMSEIKSGSYSLSTEEKQSFILINQEELRILTTKNTELK